MNKHLIELIICTIIYPISTILGQEILYYENFESEHTFIINTTDIGSLGNAGSNKWVINNVYMGGTWYYGGFYPVQVPPTASQPSSILNAPYSKYLHTVCVDASNSGISNCNFIDAASSGFVTGSAGKNFAKMNSGISTVGFTDVAFSFWWLCNGGRGTVYYSTTGGNTWNQFGSTFGSNTSWSYYEFHDSEFNNIPDLRFGFMFTNIGGTNFDPGFAVDEIYIKATPIHNAPIASFSSSQQQICQGNCIDFTDLSANQPNSWQWQFEQGMPSNSSMQHPQNICFNNAGNFSITLIVSNDDGSDTLTQTNYITVFPTPQVFLNDTYVLNSGDSIVIDAGEFVKYLWSTGDTSQIISIYQPGNYSITVSDVNDCTSTHTFIVTTQYELVFPNVITPNGDGYNDYFEIKHIDAYTQNSLTVFNRWGKKVFEQINYNNSWDGSNLSEGVYFYIFKYGNYIYNGSLTIIR